MRTLALIPLALLATACWTPGPGQMDPTRYPWDQPQLQPQASIQPISQPQPQPEGFACVVPLNPGANSGIIFSGGKASDPRCNPPPSIIQPSTSWQTGSEPQN